MTAATRVRAWLAKPVNAPTPDLGHVLAASLFVAVLVLAYALWFTYGPLAGAVGLLVPFAAWYAALTRQRVEREAHERALKMSAERAARTMTRPSAPTRTPLDEGGEVKPAPWSPTSYGGE